MSPIMTFEEIQRNYDGEWVLIAYTETDENLQAIEGEVIAHSNNKEEIYQALESARDRPLAIEYIGPKYRTKTLRIEESQLRIRQY